MNFFHTVIAPAISFMADHFAFTITAALIAGATAAILGIRGARTGR